MRAYFESCINHELKHACSNCNKNSSSNYLVQTVVYFSMNLETIRCVFKPIFSQHQYLIDHLVKLIKQLQMLRN